MYVLGSWSVIKICVNIDECHFGLHLKENCTLKSSLSYLKEHLK